MGLTPACTGCGACPKGGDMVSEHGACVGVRMRGVDTWTRGVDVWTRGMDMWTRGMDAWTRGMDMWYGVDDGGRDTGWGAMWVNMQPSLTLYTAHGRGKGSVQGGLANVV